MSEKKGLNISLFERLCRKYPERVTTLNKQYRMNKDILELTNSIVYNRKMEMGSEEISNQKVTYKQEVNSMLTWLESIKSRSVTFLKTDNVMKLIPLKERQKLRYKNHIEAAACAMIIENLRMCKIDPKQITVITPFLEQ